MYTDPKPGAKTGNFGIFSVAGTPVKRMIGEGTTMCDAARGKDMHRATRRASPAKIAANRPRACAPSRSKRICFLAFLILCLAGSFQAQAQLSPCETGVQQCVATYQGRVDCWIEQTGGGLANYNPF